MPEEPETRSSVDTNAVTVEELADMMTRQGLTGLWNRPDLPSTPVARAKAHLWQWETVSALARQAGKVVRVDGLGDARRALQFCNPGLPVGTTESLFGAYQYLEAGETAPAHRHTAAAVRFVMQGRDVFTTVNGDACDMEPGDLILTPNWNWHDHTNHGNDPIIWFDAIDVPLVVSLESMFFEQHPIGMQDVVGHNGSHQDFGAVGLREVTAKANAPSRSPLLRYPYQDASSTLDAIHSARGEQSVTITYENPLTGGSALATITCQMTRLYPGAPTAPRRQTGGQINVVFKGAGRSVIQGTEFSWSPGDVFVVPSWAAVEHEASDTADLFVASNRAVLEALNLYREDVLADAQPVTGMFQPTQP